ncbi:hypothetical protein BKA63DRAFT_395990, partial [Paraphoma chrysanthemicola]
MCDLEDRLARLGLVQYYEIFQEEGFNAWEVLMDITERDLSHLGVKLGHRRKLQRAIAESHKKSFGRPLASAPGNLSTSRGGDTRVKCKARRHPKPDTHAPRQSPSAYVIFSKQTREMLKEQNLSFAETAKVTGVKWQALPLKERDNYRRLSDDATQKYSAEMAEYKKTPHFEAYQRYLE